MLKNLFLIQFILDKFIGRMAELVDAVDSKSTGNHKGSNPFSPTKYYEI